MANQSTITLADGINAPRGPVAEPKVQAVSPAFEAFETLSEALAEACSAEEFRLDPASWDIAYSNPDVAAEDAVNVALEAARAAGNAPIALASDRTLIFVARFVHCAIGVENGPDRINVLHLLEDSQPLWRGTQPGVIAQRGNMLITRSIERLSHLMDLLYGPDDAATIAPDIDPEQTTTL
ncbi:hypothetical protein D2T29_22645 [Sinirhodobacter populi]|uniref:Uncharacterized protein n=1 Tax=Paenirhodobacter populi TaxID=2306993 RepID=A0A443JW31_9RHOB|nr:hypothetical protein [Sinirhodobacter populi]RWR24722.1 hypothetical protein D2T29_22645 [Sinirhodobacter populi]